MNTYPWTIVLMIITACAMIAYQLLTPDYTMQVYALAVAFIIITALTAITFFDLTNKSRQSENRRAEIDRQACEMTQGKRPYKTWIYEEDYLETTDLGKHYMEHLKKKGY